MKNVFVHKTEDNNAVGTVYKSPTVETINGSILFPALQYGYLIGSSNNDGQSTSVVVRHSISGQGECIQYERQQDSLDTSFASSLVMMPKIGRFHVLFRGGNIKFGIGL